MIRTILMGGLCAALNTGLAIAASPVDVESSERIVYSRLVASVLAENPELAAAQARVEAAQARAEGSRLWRNNPEIEIGRETAQDRTQTIGLSQTVEWFSKPAARGRAADWRVDGLAAEVSVVRQRVIAGVLSGLVLVDQRRAQFDLASRRVEDMAQLATLSEQLFREGDISPSAVQAARLAATQAVLTQQTARIDQSLADQELANLVGMPLDTSLQIGEPLPETLQIGEVNIDQLAVVSAARFRREAADNDISVARWDQVPDPSVGVRYGDEGGTDLFGISISIPIPVLNTGQTEVAAARADAVSAAADLAAARRSATFRLRESARRYDTLRASQALWQMDGSTALSAQTNLLERRLNGGDVDVVSYLVQMQQLYDIEAASIELQGQAWVAWFQLLEAAGVIEEWIGVEQ